MCEKREELGGYYRVWRKVRQYLYFSFNMRSILGNFHQGDKIFQNAGTQCTAIAYYALAFFHFSSTFLDLFPHHLNSEVVDNILIDGNALYENLPRSYRFENGHYFAHDELPDQESVNFCNLETCIYPDLLFGIVGLGVYENEFEAISLNDAIDTGFGLSEYIICIVMFFFIKG